MGGTDTDGICQGSKLTVIDSVGQEIVYCGPGTPYSRNWSGKVTIILDGNNNDEIDSGFLITYEKQSM